MKTLVVAALTVAAISANIAFAEEDDVIVSAEPAIADPINPQQGMMFNAYDVRCRDFKNSFSESVKWSPVKTCEDRGENFSLAQIGDLKATIGKWEGFITSKRAATLTFLINGSVNGAEYLIRVNGKMIIPVSKGQKTVDVNFKVGWNKIEVISEFDIKNRPLTMLYKVKGQVTDPKPLTPAMMKYDKPLAVEDPLG